MNAFAFMPAAFSSTRNVITVTPVANRPMTARNSVASMFTGAIVLTRSHQNRNRILHAQERLAIDLVGDRRKGDSVTGGGIRVPPDALHGAGFREAPRAMG